jgi:PAS domain S-box-containing protein
VQRPAAGRQENTSMQVPPQTKADSSSERLDDAHSGIICAGEFAGEAEAFRSAFEHAAIGKALVRPDGRFLKVNRSLCRIVGYSEAELLATDFQTITHPDDLEADVALAGQAFRGEIDHYHMEKRYFHKQGNIIWILLSVTVVFDDQRTPLYAIAQIQDITARKAAEQQAARRLRQLERLTDTVSRIFRELEGPPDDTMYPRVLRIALDSFESEAGLFLRLADDDVLVGTYLSQTRNSDVRCLPSHRCKLWTMALDQKMVVVENRPRSMGCGRRVTRSLVAPIFHNGTPLGLFHLGDGAADYDADDCDLLSRVANIIAPVLNAQRKRAALTPREAEVMDLIVSGLSQKQIAAALDIGMQTAAKHRAKVLRKLNVDNDVELVRLVLPLQPALV